MVRVTMKSFLSESIENVWNIVTNLEDCKWRSDLEKIELIKPEKQFVEYTKEGFSTTFTITKKEPFSCYEFDMDNVNMSGHWIGKFKKVENGVFLEFTENVEVKKWFLKPFVKIYLKKQQAQYLEDLKKAFIQK